jgi:hypothetical protein
LCRGRSAAVVRQLLASSIALALTSGASAAEIKIGYLRLQEPRATISLLDVPSDTGDVASLRVINTIQVGELPWGITISQQ